jgi:hypothetical protein
MNVASRRAAAAALAALIAAAVLALLAADGRHSERSEGPPTPCPDSVACHALKRKPTP